MENIKIYKIIKADKTESNYIKNVYIYVYNAFTSAEYTHTRARARS